MHAFFSRLSHSPISRLAAAVMVTVVVLAWSSIAYCGEIHDAAKSGDVEKVRTLLKGNPDLVFSKDKDGTTPLHYAAQEGHKDVAAFLLASKADVNAKTKIGATPLHWAAFDGHKDVAGVLLANGTDVNAKDNDGNTPLYDAAFYGHKDVVELLLANKADVNARDNDGDTPLKVAVQGGYGDVADLPRQQGGNGSKGTTTGTISTSTRAITTTKTDQTPTASMTKSSSTSTEACAQESHLFKAATDGDLSRVKALITAKADVNAKNTWGNTALMFALAKGHMEVEKVLIAARATDWLRDTLATTTTINDAEPKMDAQDIYKQGFDAFQKGAYNDAALLFTRFLQENPESPLAPNAYYWTGESYMCQKNYEKAIVQFQQVVDKFPKSHKAGKALLRQAEAFGALGDKKRSTTLLKRIVELFPRSEEARLAERKLRGDAHEDTATQPNRPAAEAKVLKGKLEMAFGMSVNGPLRLVSIVSSGRRFEVVLTGKTIVPPGWMEQYFNGAFESGDYSVRGEISGDQITAGQIKYLGTPPDHSK